MKLKKKGIFSPPKEIETPPEKHFVNLSEVMDYNLEFSMFFSGVENDTYFKGCYDMGVRDFLMSYHYLQRTRASLHQKYGGLGIKFMIDSGAFTYSRDAKYAEYSIDHWEKHIQRYLAWAERNREYIFSIVNCDFEGLVDSEIVQEWNEKFFEPFMLRTGIPVCFVWHDNSYRTWEQYCQRYPYVGISAVNTGSNKDFDMADFLNIFKVAEKHNTLVHGFGMTKTGMLPKLPFYTVDSTSWKSGFMYGLVAYWNGKKVGIAPKDQFEKAFKFISMYDLDPPIDKEKVYEYYEPEVLRANVFAYLKAVDFIRDSLKPLSYWKKEKALIRTEEDLKSFEFPPASYLSNVDFNSGWEEYAKSMNISTEDEKNARNSIADMTVFLNWENPDYKDYIGEVYTEDLISEIHYKWVNKVAASTEEKIEHLKKFFFDCWSGENTTLLYYGTNFDRLVKERDEYLDEPEYEDIDVPEKEVKGMLAGFLPSGSDGSSNEITELDDEIFRNVGIEPVRDSKGRFLKGQKRVRKPKKLYSEKYPQYACDWCVNAQKCPEYKEGYVCAYRKMFQRFKSRDMNDVLEGMEGLADLSMERLQMAMLSEKMNGGIPDPAVSQLMNQSMNFLTQLERIHEMRGREVISQTKVLKSDGTQEMTTRVSNPQSGGLLAKLFMQNNADEDEEIVDASYEVITEEKETEK